MEFAVELSFDKKNVEGEKVVQRLFSGFSFELNLGLVMDTYERFDTPARRFRL